MKINVDILEKVEKIEKKKENEMAIRKAENKYIKRCVEANVCPACGNINNVVNDDSEEIHPSSPFYRRKCGECKKKFQYVY